LKIQEGETHMQKEKFWRDFPKGTQTIKITGSLSQIDETSEILKEHYKDHEIRFSAFLKNLEDGRLHLYVNILPLSSVKKTEEEA
jgi:hypothetical protein